MNTENETVNTEEESAKIEVALNREKEVAAYKSAVNAEFQVMIQEADRLNTLIQEAKTSLKRDLYTKKLEKLKKKTYRMLLNKAIADPSILKDTEE